VKFGSKDAASPWKRNTGTRTSIVAEHHEERAAVHEDLVRGGDHACGTCEPRRAAERERPSGRALPQRREPAAADGEDEEDPDHACADHRRRRDPLGGEDEQRDRQHHARDPVREEQ
jgi:hypothetical protein